MPLSSRRLASSRPSLCGIETSSGCDMGSYVNLVPSPSVISGGRILPVRRERPSVATSARHADEDLRAKRRRPPSRASDTVRRLAATLRDALSTTRAMRTVKRRMASAPAHFQTYEPLKLTPSLVVARFL